MKIRLVCFTEKGAVLCLQLAGLLKGAGHEAEGFSKRPCAGLSPLETPVRDFAGEAFGSCDALVFIGAAGIAVRAVAPFVASKDKDPAVVVADELGRFVIPLLSGHLGGANALAAEIAGLLGATPVVTTATDLNGCFAVDVWAKANGCRICNVEEIKTISSAVLRGEKVGFCSDFPVSGSPPEPLRFAESGEIGVSVSDSPEKAPFRRTLRLVPMRYAVGVGCRKGIGTDALERFFTDTLARCGAPPEAVRSAATIDLKQNEPAVRALCRKFGLALAAYSARELGAVPGRFSASDFVRSVTGVDNVCERAAVRASGGRLIQAKTVRQGMTLAVAESGFRCVF